jgi:hypothetical protein
MHEVGDVDALDGRIEDAGVGSGQYQELVGKAAQPFHIQVHGLLDAPVLLGGPLSSQAALELRTHQRQGRAELMGGVGCKASEAVKCGLEAPQHRVEGLDQFAQLVLAHLHFYPSIEVVLAERADEAGDPRDR